METEEELAEAEVAFEGALTGEAIQEDSEKDDSEDSQESEQEDFDEMLQDDESPFEEEDDEEDSQVEDIEDTYTVKLPAIPSVHPELKEGDYSLSESGKYEIHAEHLSSDIDAILSKDASVFLKIAKAKPAKADAIAKILGIKGDSTRTPREVFSDVVKTLKKETDQSKATSILGEHLPFLVDRNFEVPFSLAANQRKEEEINTSVEKEVDVDKAFDIAAKKIVKDSQGEITQEMIETDENLIEAVKKYRFNQETGLKNSVYKQLSLAAEEVFGGEYEEVREPAMVGGVSQRSSNSEGGASAEELAFEKALMGDK